jgi:PA14 domain/FlgD Ig-like domain
MGGITSPEASEELGAPATITYNLHQPGQVSLAVYDQAGVQLRTLLTGEKQQAGMHTVAWDGLDRNGKPLPRGTYEWRLLRTPGFTRQFLVSVGTNPSWSVFDLWPGNHAGPTMLMVDHDSALYVGSISSEGPPHLLKLSLDGRRKFWDTGRWDFGDGIIGIARVNDALYLLDWDGRLWIRRADNGAEFYGHPQRRRFAEQRIPFADLSGSQKPPVAQAQRKHQVVYPMSMAAGKDFLAITFQERGEVQFLWPGMDQFIRRKSVKLTDPKGVASAPDGRAFVICGDAIYQVNPENGIIKELVHGSPEDHPTRLAYDAFYNDLIVVEQGPGVSHVRRYNAEDGRLVAVYGRPTGRTYGRFNPLDWDAILDIAADGKGGFFTVEEFPRRVAHFRGRGKHELVQQWFGGMQWGALCALDPDDPTVVYVFPDHKHCGRGMIDYQTRSWTLTDLYELPENFSWNLGTESHRGMFPAFGGQSYWSVRHIDGATFLVNNGRPYGGEGVSVVRIDEQKQRIVPVARLGVLHPTLDKLKAPEWWLAAMRRAGYGPAPSGYDHFCYTWADSNHNGKIELDEIVLARRFHGYTESQFHIDDHWNVYRIVRSGANPWASRRSGVSDSIAWLVVANKGKVPFYPVWSWGDALPSRGRLSQGEFGDITPSPAAIYRDSKGNTYEVCNGEADLNAPDIPPSSWPNNTTGASRVLKWNAAGAREWSVGVHTDSKRGLPGQFADIRAILGEVRDCLVVLDACSPATVWTRDGLYAGSFLDRREQDRLPDIVYNRVFGDDNEWGQVLELPLGKVIWGALSDQSTFFYRIEGWDNWERHTGKVRLRAKPPIAHGRGTGLHAEYFENTELSGPPTLTRQDSDIWFGPMWGDHRELKARNDWFKKGERRTFDPGSCSARWTGFLEVPISEEFTFVIYVYGHRPGPEELLGSKVRMWLDGKKIIDEWDQVRFQKVYGWWRTRPCYSSKVSLEAGKLLSLKLEYEGTGGKEANLHLYWQSPSLDLRHVPQKYLYPSKILK